MQAIRELLNLTVIGTPRSYGSLTMFSVLGPARGDAPAYLTLDEAAARDLVDITEIGAGGTVPTIRVVNRAERPVLLVDGEHLVGAKQNRVLNVTVLVAAKSELDIPVSCVEQGRWAMTRPKFAPARDALYARARAEKARQVSESLRSTGRRRADQAAIWHDISLKAARMSVAPETGAMAELFEAAAPDIEAFERAMPPADNQIGAIFAIGAAPAGVDLFDHPRTLAALLPKLVRSWALDAVERPAAVETADSGAASELLERIAGARAEVFPAVGLGQELRFEGRATHGAALVHDGAVVHLCAFAEDASAEAGYGIDSGMRSASARRAARWRH